MNLLLGQDKKQDPSYKNHHASSIVLVRFQICMNTLHMQTKQSLICRIKYFTTFRNNSSNVLNVVSVKATSILFYDKIIIFKIFI